MNKWRQQDELELAQELARERAGRQKLVQRIGPAKAAEIERTAQRIEREQAAERAKAQQRADHVVRMAKLRRRIAQDQADERAIAQLKAKGVPESDRRITIRRLGITARKYEAEVKG